MLKLFTSLITANPRLNLLIMAWIVISPLLSYLPILGGASGFLSGYILSLIMAAELSVIVEEQEPELIKEALSSMGIAELISRVNLYAVFGAYLGMLINGFIITVSSVLFFALLTLPAVGLSFLHPQIHQLLENGRLAIYLLFCLFLTLSIAFNFLFTAGVAMARGLISKGFLQGLAETLKGLTPRYFLLSLKPGLWKPSLALILIAVTSTLASITLAIVLGFMGLPFMSVLWAVLGLILFHANIAFHYTCLKIMNIEPQPTYH